LEGRPEEYKGKLNAPRHLSVFERVTGRHGEYDPKWAMKLVEKERSRMAAATSTSTSYSGGSGDGADRKQ